MPIAQLGFEGRYPVFTWATKPAANSVPVGTRITIIGWNAPPSDWVSDGTYWLPVGGRAVVHAPVLLNAQAQSTARTLVSSVPTWQMPSDIAHTPRIRVEAWAHCSVSSPSNAQARQIYIGNSTLNNVVASSLYTDTNPVQRVWGWGHRRPNGLWTYALGNMMPMASVQPDIPGPTSAEMAASPIGLYYRGGNTDGSEVLNVDTFAIAVGVG